MGQDKAQIEFRGQPLISWAFDFLRLNFASVLIAGDRHQAGEAGGSEA
jgi:molybdopterin-guanine dinucleotide biosynthesis protein A